jgi:cytochrome c biogenesis protein CcmG/thiol:disulfide interchange protein DsbE
MSQSDILPATNGWSKRLLFAVPIAGFIILAGMFGIGLTKDPSVIPSQLIDRPLPEFKLPGLSASAPGFGNADLKGKPMLLNVFASWCAACPQEHPMLTRISSEGTPVYGIDWKDTPADATDWLGRLGNPYTRVASDPTARTGIDLGVTGVPETFVVDKRGRVRYKQIGPIDGPTWETLLKPMLAKLEAEA